MTYSDNPNDHPFEPEQSCVLVGPGAPYFPRLDYCRKCGQHRTQHGIVVRPETELTHNQTSYEAGRRDGKAELRHFYIGAVSLLCRVYNRLPERTRKEFKADGDPMRRLALDFNEQTFSLKMIEDIAGGGYGARRWGLREHFEDVSPPNNNEKP